MSRPRRFRPRWGKVRYGSIPHWRDAPTFSCSVKVPGRDWVRVESRMLPHAREKGRWWVVIGSVMVVVDRHRVAYRPMPNPAGEQFLDDLYVEQDGIPRAFMGSLPR